MSRREDEQSSPGASHFTPRSGKRLTRAAVALTGAGAILALAACGGPSSSPSDAGSPSAATGAAVARNDVAAKLRPLATAVVAYTDADYGEDPADPATLALAEANFAKVEAAEQKWLDFSSGIDFAASNIAGLEPAIQDYNQALNNWQSYQAQGLAMWQDCIDANGDSTMVAMCMLENTSMEDEQASLTDYTSAVKQLLSALGVTM